MIKIAKNARVSNFNVLYNTFHVSKVGWEPLTLGFLGLLLSDLGFLFLYSGNTADWSVVLTSVRAFPSEAYLVSMHVNISLTTRDELLFGPLTWVWSGWVNLKEVDQVSGPKFNISELGGMFYALYAFEFPFNKGFHRNAA